MLQPPDIPEEFSGKYIIAARPPTYGYRPIDPDALSADTVPADELPALLRVSGRC